MLRNDNIVVVAIAGVFCPLQNLFVPEIKLVVASRYTSRTTRCGVKFAHVRHRVEVFVCSSAWIVSVEEHVHVILEQIVFVQTTVSNFTSLLGLFRCLRIVYFISFVVFVREQLDVLEFLLRLPRLDLHQTLHDVSTIVV